MEGLETTSGGAAGTKGTGGAEEGDGRGLDELLGDDLGDEDMDGMEQAYRLYSCIVQASSHNSSPPMKKNYSETAS
ncbi:hypothetical protein DL767_010227 [Monosporascus sp. MG133]|nr:hypothetical protein DL767_010227 [Monosporascus sp. MG133]